MSLPLINFISIALTAVSLVVFFAALRKAKRLTAMSRIMAHQVASSAANLQQALAILQAERESCRDESVRLEARLKDSDRVRSEITRAIDLVERAKNDLKDNVRVMPASVQQADTAPATPAFIAKAAPVAPAKILPVFVNRVVRSADVASAVL
ncbi:BAB2_0123 family type IV secretion system effector [Phyllobacterium bourgognense]|uniref:Uncharacterized protein n=1 Tax=Phyllobacterium bourgognense TaxID=314236 RepID=A0A368YPX6_9HYPH|nr:hypothetical protein [Phyllobacterium bourgognense]RCW82282.1 hypothetical protein C7476_10896 [Phyllobacterium bourgognense]